MIPSDRIHDNGDGTAWLVIGGPDHDARIQGVEGWKWDDRPCDTCGGDGEFANDLNEGHWQDCPDCAGTGRHTFEIEVDTPKYITFPSGASYTPTIRLRASVVPDMVLPIVSGAACESPPPRVHHVCIHEHPDGFLIPPNNAQLLMGGLHDSSRAITLPPAAAPGMFAIKLESHTY